MRCKLSVRRTPPIESKISPKKPFFLAQHSHSFSSNLVLRLTTATAALSWNSLSQATGLVNSSTYRASDLISFSTFLPRDNRYPYIPKPGPLQAPRQDSRQSLSQLAKSLAAAGALGLSPTPRGEQIYGHYTSTACQLILHTS
jgi:hypothetical protein